MIQNPATTENSYDTQYEFFLCNLFFASINSDKKSQEVKINTWITILHFYFYNSIAINNATVAHPSVVHVPIITRQHSAMKRPEVSSSNDRTDLTDLDPLDNDPVISTDVGDLDPLVETC